MAAARDDQTTRHVQKTRRCAPARRTNALPEHDKHQHRLYNKETQARDAKIEKKVKNDCLQEEGCGRGDGGDGGDTGGSGGRGCEGGGAESCGEAEGEAAAAATGG